MYNITSILLTDFYKQCHAEQYDSRIKKLVSYYTPRASRFKEIEEIPVIGIQSFIKEYLIDHFNENFFNRPLSSVIAEYEFIIGETMGHNRVNSQKIIDLHKLGYLPLEIKAIDEGTRIPVKCPVIEISNTHDNFAWCTNVIESLMSSELWYQSCTAISGMLYRNIVNKYYDLTSDNLNLKKSAISEFGFRGLPGLQAAQKASMGFLLSFNKTATIPAIYYLHQMYGDEMKTIGTGMASTEHSVMCSSTSLDNDEITLIKKLFTEIYPDGNFSMVCDSYDYWNVIENILPELKEEIFSRNGTVYIRGDSGNPIDISTETVFKLWDIFGGTINSKGFKVLDSHIRVIYGDSITQLRAEKIYEILMKNGFSAENVVLGAGSFSMLCLEREYQELLCVDSYGDEHFTTNTKLAPFTRDGFGVAIKTTYGEYEYVGPSMKSGNICTSDLISKIIPFNIFKNPKTDKENFKKSQKGCCIVNRNHHSRKIFYEDGYNLIDTKFENNFLTTVFKNGKLLKKTSFEEIRNRFWNNEF